MTQQPDPVRAALVGQWPTTAIAACLLAALPYMLWQPLGVVVWIVAVTAMRYVRYTQAKTQTSKRQRT